MNIHEYQAKEIFRNHNIPVPRGNVAHTVDEAVSVAENLGGSLWVVKAQIHAGGRGKGGGVKIAKSLDDVREMAGEILGMTLVTHQTGPQGKEVHQLLIEEGISIDKEMYLGMTLDRKAGVISVIASTEGGMEIEEVAANTPEKILHFGIDPLEGLDGFAARKLAFGLGLKGKTALKAGLFMQSLYRVINQTDASLAEINPLVITAEGDVMALDAKMNFDDNALRRQPAIEAYRDLNEEDPKEVEARKFDLNYIALDGDIGCMVNGAGLAMASMDTIKHFGGAPANFLDVGGGAKKEQIANAFRIILSDPNVKAILVNIFGGIMLCDVVAEGVVAAARDLGLQVPLIVRLEGNNVEKGREILANSGLDLIPASSLAEAAQKAVVAVS